MKLVAGIFFILLPLLLAIAFIAGRRGIDTALIVLAILGFVGASVAFGLWLCCEWEKKH